MPRPIKPITVEVEVLVPADSGRPFGVVRVTSQGKATEYLFRLLFGGGRLAGVTFHKAKAGSKDQYSVELESYPRCECRDYLHRRQYTESGECKHVKAALRLAADLQPK